MKNMMRMPFSLGSHSLDSDSKGKAVCTPSIKGAGYSLSGYWSRLLLEIALLYHTVIIDSHNALTVALNGRTSL